MSAPVVAIALDALAHRLLETWISAGKLPTLARLMEQGAYARQQNFSMYRTENSWLTLLHGCSAEASKEWGHQSYETGSYEFTEHASYEFKNYLPFYALGDQKRVVVFDVPLTGLVGNVNGAQILGWGTESNQIVRQSQPPELMAEIIARHGRHPVYDSFGRADDGIDTMSYRMPCLYDIEALRDIRDRLIVSTHQRTAIIRDLIARERWDLLVAVYAEIHTAGHIFWHLSQAHPLASALQPAAGSDFMLDILQAIDADLAQVIDDLPEDTQLFVFSPHGMQANSIDLYSMFFLPELLYRWSTGEAAFSGHAAGTPVPPVKLGFRRHWSQEIWDLRSAHGDAVLESPAEQEAQQDPLDWDPANWYRRAWPMMRAFVIPGYSEGLIRINVAGRDGPDGIAPEDFARVCDEIEQLVLDVVDPATGERIADRVVRVRATPGTDSPDESPADMMVMWRDDLTAGAVEHPRLGQIGPIPYFRSGGHATEGFVIARGAGFAPGTRMDAISTPDFTATILDRLGVALPAHIEGRPVA